MTDLDSQGPREADHLFMVPTPQPTQFQPLEPYRVPTGAHAPTNPWAVASYSLAILAFLLVAMPSPLVDVPAPVLSMGTSILAMLCGAMALATQLISRRQMHGAWMALLAIAASAVPLLLTAVTQFMR